MSLWSFANPAKFFGTPDDYQQGSTVKILYIHVPSALMAINAWAMMLVASLIWLIRRHHYWAWDPRLTSFLILFIFYLGYMALWSAVEDTDKAADLTSILCLIGSVFAFLSRYAVNFWSQGLHQGASLSLDRISALEARAQ